MKYLSKEPIVFGFGSGNHEPIEHPPIHEYTLMGGMCYHCGLDEIGHDALMKERKNESGSTKVRSAGLFARRESFMRRQGH